MIPTPGDLDAEGGVEYLVAHDVLKLLSGPFHQAAPLQGEDRRESVIEPATFEDGREEDVGHDEVLQLVGVAQVDVWGGFNREVRIEVDPDRLKAAGIPLDRILKAWPVVPDPRGDAALVLVGAAARTGLDRDPGLDAQAG